MYSTMLGIDKEYLGGTFSYIELNQWEMVPLCANEEGYDFLYLMMCVLSKSVIYYLFNTNFFTLIF